MTESPKFIATTSVGIFLIASALAWAVIATANPYSGANFAVAALLSCPIYFLGIVAGIRCLRATSFRSPLGWVALTVNLIPFGFTAFLIAVGVTGHW